MKTRLTICSISAFLCAGSYIIFSILAYIKSPLPISPLRNWLSDLGNQVTNPAGAIFYNIGVITCAVFLAIWFTAGISQWKSSDHPIQRRLLLIAQLTGVLTSFTLMMSAIYPINHLKEHAFWSDANFILFGISFAFSVAALRYFPDYPRILLVLGGFAAILPTLLLSLNNFYWLEWVAVGIFMTYILSIGAQAGLRPQAAGLSG